MPDKKVVGGACGVGGTCCICIGLALIICSAVVPAGLLVVREAVLEDVRIVKDEANWEDKNEGATITSYQYCVFDITNALAVQRSAAKMDLNEICVNLDQVSFYYDVEFSTDMELYTYKSWKYYVVQSGSVDAMATVITQANPLWVGGMTSYGGESVVGLGLIADGTVGQALFYFYITGLSEYAQYKGVPTYLSGIIDQVAATYGYDLVWGQWGNGAISSLATGASGATLATLTGSPALEGFELYASTSYAYALSDAQCATLLNVSGSYSLTNDAGYEMWLTTLMAYSTYGDPSYSPYYVDLATALGGDASAFTMVLTYLSTLIFGDDYFNFMVSAAGISDYVADWDMLAASQFGASTLVPLIVGDSNFNSILYMGMSDMIIVAPEYSVWYTEKWVYDTDYATSGLLTPMQSYYMLYMLAVYGEEFAFYYYAKDYALNVLTAQFIATYESYGYDGATAATVGGAAAAQYHTAIYQDWLSGTCSYASVTADLGLSCSGFDYTLAGISGTCTSYDSSGLATCENWGATFKFAEYIANDLLLKNLVVGEQVNPLCMPPAYGGCETVLTEQGTGAVNSGLFMSRTIDEYLFGWTDPYLGLTYATVAWNCSTKDMYELINGVETFTMYTGNGDAADANKYYSMCEALYDNSTVPKVMTVAPRIPYIESVNSTGNNVSTIPTTCTDQTQFFVRADFGGDCKNDYDTAGGTFSPTPWDPLLGSYPSDTDCKVYRAPEVLTGKYSTQIPHSMSGKRLYDDLESIWVDEIKRGVNFSFVEEVEIYGVTGFRYEISDKMLSGYNSETPNAANAKYLMPDSAVLPMQRASSGVPAYATTPHFLGADSSYTDPFTGLVPDASIHTSYITIEPITGKAIDGGDILQQALGVGKDVLNGASSTNTYGSIWGSTFYHADELLVPMWWLSKSRMITEQNGKDLVYGLYTSLKAIAGLGLALLIPGIICMVLGCGCGGFGGSQIATGGAKKVEPV